MIHLSIRGHAQASPRRDLEAGFQFVLQTRGFVQPEHQKEETKLRINGDWCRPETTAMRGQDGVAPIDQLTGLSLRRLYSGPLMHVKWMLLWHNSGRGFYDTATQSLERRIRHLVRKTTAVLVPYRRLGVSTNSLMSSSSSSDKFSSSSSSS